MLRFAAVRYQTALPLPPAPGSRLTTARPPDKEWPLRFSCS